MIEKIQHGELTLAAQRADYKTKDEFTAMAFGLLAAKINQIIDHLNSQEPGGTQEVEKGTLIAAKCLTCGDKLETMESNCSCDTKGIGGVKED